jgi:hypothetical protein
LVHGQLQHPRQAFDVLILGRRPALPAIPPVDPPGEGHRGEADEATELLLGVAGGALGFDGRNEAVGYLIA